MSAAAVPEGTSSQGKSLMLTEASAIMFPQLGSGGGTPSPRKLMPVSYENRHRREKRKLHQHRTENARDNVADHDRGIAEPADARGLDVELAAHIETTLRTTRIMPAEPSSPTVDHRGQHIVMEDSEHGQQNHDRRQRKHEVDDLIDHAIQPPAVIARRDAEADADHARDDHRLRDADERRPAAVKQQAEHIAAERIRAEPMRGRWAVA